MPDGDEPDAPAADESDQSDARRREAARRRKRLDELFGDVLPSTTRDESTGRGRPSTGGPADGDRDDELRRDVPPHHS